jgi:hypothetical protein
MLLIHTNKSINYYQKYYANNNLITKSVKESNNLRLNRTIEALLDYNFLIKIKHLLPKVKYF